MFLTLDIPVGAAVAFLAEAALFFSLASKRWQRLTTSQLIPVLGCTFVVPYLLLTLSAGTFNSAQFVQLFFVAIAPVLWLATLPRRRWLDLLLTALLVAVYVSPFFRTIYGESTPAFLGRAMWVRSGIAAFLLIAREPGIGFGFWPSKEDWLIGGRYFLLFLVPGLGIGWLLGYLRAPEPRVLQGIGMFIGSLWFVALAEEFFFRGLLQRWIGLPVAALLYGLSHLGFRQFPNWRHVVITILLGFFCGLAFRQRGSIRAAIVTHSLVNGLWVGVLGKL